MSLATLNRYDAVITQICNLDWSSLSAADLTNVAGAYYYFSVQFRENLEIAVALRPYDAKLADLNAGECDTDNLSPFPGVAVPGERLNHDEFMRRALALGPWSDTERERVARLGEVYLEKAREIEPYTRALSIASYEDGGLERVFTSFLRAPVWKGPCLAAFRHFLEKHIEFDSDVEAGHGALSRHLEPDDRILPLWEAFRDLLLQATPARRG